MNTLAIGHGNKNESVPDLARLSTDLLPNPGRHSLPKLIVILLLVLTATYLMTFL